MKPSKIYKWFLKLRARGQSDKKIIKKFERKRTGAYLVGQPINQKP